MLDDNNSSAHCQTSTDLHFTHKQYRKGWIIFQNGFSEADNIPFLAIRRCDTGFRLITLNRQAAIHQEITLFTRIMERMKNPNKIKNSQKFFYNQPDVSKYDLSIFSKKTSILIEAPEGTNDPVLLIGYADSYDEGRFFQLFLYG